MNIPTPADSGQRTERNAVFADFVREALTILLVTTLALVWVWTSFVGMFDPDRTPQGYLVLALTSVGSFAVYTLARRRLHLAVTLYLLTLLAAIQIVVSAYADASLLTLYLLVVLVAAPLTAPRGLGVTTLLVLAAMVATGAQRGTQAAELVIPIMLTALTGLTAWLSTRRLFTALGWALTMTDKAMGSAEEARDHRLELQRVLHSLDLALSRLERNNRALAFAQEAAE